MAFRNLIKNTASYRKVLLKTLLGAVTVAFGMDGFIKVYEPTDVAGYVECVFKTVQLLFAQFPAVLTTPSGGNADIPLSLNIARFAMPALFVWVAASALLHRIRQPLRAAGVDLLSGHVILVGQGELIPALLKAVRRDKRRAVVITPAAGTPLTDTAEKLGATIVIGDAADPDTWRRSGLRHARSAFILGADDAHAVAAALAVADAAREERDGGGSPVEVVCAIEDPDLRALVEGAYRGRRALPGVTLQTNSSAELRARSVIQRHPLYRSVDVQAGEKVRALVLGFGATGEQVALQVVKSGIVDEGALPEVIAVDRAASRIERAFATRHGHAPPLQQAIRFTDAEVDLSDAEGIERLFVAGPGAGANVIYLCLDDDTRTLLIAVAIRRAQCAAGLPTPPIYCRQHGGGHLSRRLASADLRDVDLTRIFGFGQVDEASALVLAGDVLDRRARAIHDYYLQNFPPAPGAPALESQRPWPALAEGFRQSSRDQADFLPMRLACLGLREGKAPGPVLQLPADQIERAARTEHARWSTSVQLMGWRPGEVRDNDRMLHSDLVAYEALSEAARDKDRAVLKDISAILASEGSAVRPLIQATASGAAEIEHAHDGVPVIISGLEDAQACESLHAAVSGRPGLVWRLKLAGSVAGALESLETPDARDKARWLVNNADQVLQNLKAAAPGA